MTPWYCVVILSGDFAFLAGALRGFTTGVFARDFFVGAFFFFGAGDLLFKNRNLEVNRLRRDNYLEYIHKGKDHQNIMHTLVVDGVGKNVCDSNYGKLT